VYHIATLLTNRVFICGMLRLGMPKF